MNRYSLIFLDIDGTLLDSHHAVSPNTRKLLTRLEKKGVPVILASGRTPCGVELAARQADVHAPIICYNGGLILDENRAIMEDVGIEGELAVSFKSFVNRQFPAISFHSYIYDIWLVDNKEDTEARHLAEMTHSEALECSLASALRSVKHAHKFLCAGNPRSIQRLREAAETEFPALSFSNSSAVYLDVVRKGVSKRAAMGTIQRYYGVDAAQVAAIGDYYEDMEMLREAGLGIAMENAPEAVRKAADRVTADNDNEGVFIALKHLRFQAPLFP